MTCGWSTERDTPYVFILKFCTNQNYEDSGSNFSSFILKLLLGLSSDPWQCSEVEINRKLEPDQ